jgi:uncharacterized protein YjbI with pentapeptide repeats
MANNSGVSIQNKPIRIAQNLGSRHTHPKGRDVTSSVAAVASYQVVIGRPIANDIQRDPAWMKIPLSLVVQKLRSSDHRIVLQAVEELRARGCLSDSTLSWICLRYANLQGANLSAADLKNADLHKANLETADLSYANLNSARFTKARLQSVNLDEASLDEANLVGANLQGAKNLSNEQLAQVGRMRGSVLPDGTLYDGRFNLPGDFADASILHVDLNNPAAIAAFYGVSPEDFLRGQEWRRLHMPFISAWHESACFQNAELIMNWL